MALTGFDPSVVNTSINNVKNAYSELIGVLGDDMQSKFVGGMADKWACNQAQTFFNSVFKPSIDSLISSATTTFESVVSAMNSAAQAWASSTDSEYSPSQFTPVVKNIDVSSIQENINGVRGIDFESASQTATTQLQVVESSSGSALSKAKTAVENCGFIGGTQQSNLIASLEKIKNSIDNTVQTIATETTNAINNTVQTYTDTAGKISQAFTVEG